MARRCQPRKTTTTCSDGARRDKQKGALAGPFSIRNVETLLGGWRRDLDGFGLAAALLEDEVVALGGDKLGLGLAGTGTGRDEAADDDVFLKTFEKVGLAG